MPIRRSFNATESFGRATRIRERANRIKSIVTALVIAIAGSAPLRRGRHHERHRSARALVSIRIAEHDRVVAANGCGAVSCEPQPAFTFGSHGEKGARYAVSFGRVPCRRATRGRRGDWA